MATNPYTAPDLSTLVAQGRAAVQTALQGESVGMARRAASYLLIRVLQDALVPAVAWGLWGVYKAAELISLQSTPATATDEALDLQGLRVNRMRVSATKAVRMVDLYGTVGVSVSEGDLILRGDGAVYELTTGYTWPLTGFSTGLLARAVVAGADGNHDSGTYLRLAEPPVGVSAGVVDVGASVVGADAETDTVYRQPVIEAYQGAGARGGHEDDLIFWAESVAGVDSATVVSPEAGYATITVAGPGPTAPAAGVVAAVQAYLDEVGPADARYTVVAWSA